MLGLNWTHNFPLMCPRKEELQSLLAKSLLLEELVMPEFFSTKLGREEHVQAFWKLVNKKKAFCWLDVQRLFEGTSSYNDLLVNRMSLAQW